jgi:hypothetical protein
MGRTQMWVAVAGTIAFLASGCGSDRASGTTDQSGQIVVALAASGGTGATTSSYVLANASFQVTGPTNTFVLASGDPSASDLTATVPVGRYTVTLLPGWQVERLDGSTQSTNVTDTPVDATLQSSDTMIVSVFSGQTTAVAFQFQTSGIPLTFAPGGLDIGADFTTCDAEPPPGVELNVIPDPGFETSENGWVDGNGNPLSQGLGHCGHYGAATLDGSIGYRLPDPGGPTTYSVSLWARIPSGPETVIVEINSPCAGNFQEFSVPSDTWTRFFAEFPAGAYCPSGPELVIETEQTLLVIDDVYVIPR